MTESPYAILEMERINLVLNDILKAIKEQNEILKKLKQ